MHGFKLSNSYHMGEDLLQPVLLSAHKMSLIIKLCLSCYQRNEHLGNSRGVATHLHKEKTFEILLVHESSRSLSVRTVSSFCLSGIPWTGL